jgi:hypothetical protein
MLEELKLKISRKVINHMLPKRKPHEDQTMKDNGIHNGIIELPRRPQRPALISAHVCKYSTIPPVADVIQRKESGKEQTAAGKAVLAAYETLARDKSREKLESTLAYVSKKLSDVERLMRRIKYGMILEGLRFDGAEDGKVTHSTAGQDFEINFNY